MPHRAGRVLPLAQPLHIPFDLRADPARANSINGLRLHEILLQHGDNFLSCRQGQEAIVLPCLLVMCPISTQRHRGSEDFGQSGTEHSRAQKCDNLKTGVVRPDLYDPRINLAYGELAGFYGALIDPARARKPKDKPRIERPMPYIRDSFFAGREFTSLAQMQAEALRWATEVYGVHKHRGLDGQTPASVFAAIEVGALMPLPPRAFESVVYGLGRVAPDCHLLTELTAVFRHVSGVIGEWRFYRRCRVRRPGGRAGSVSVGGSGGGVAGGDGLKVGAVSAA